MTLFLFLTALLLELIYTLLFILTIRLPGFRFWPPPSARSWQFFSAWLMASIVFVNFFFLGLLDFDSAFLPDFKIRFPIAMIFFIIGVFIGSWGGAVFGFRATLGLGNSLVTRGPYRYTRNPQYIGDSLNALGYMIFTNSWMVGVIGILGVILNLLAPFTEEPWLEERYGEDYREYKRHVPRFIFFLLFFLLTACGTRASPVIATISSIPPTLDRITRIPAGAVKVTAGTDANPPQVLVAGYEKPVPVPGVVNTAGAEDSPFITPDGNTLYFFFTPDVKIPVEKQLLDGVTGIYVSKNVNGQWNTPERILLQDPGKLALDGCEFVQGNVMLFCSAREGYEGIHWFMAQYRDGKWQDWKIADFAAGFQVGELHFTANGSRFYFASDRPGGKGGMDIWTSTRVNGVWQEPVNVAAVNTQDAEGWPALSPDDKELWLTRNYSLWRSKSLDGEWQPPEQIISSLAGEASLDEAGNVYFVHHYYKDDQMIEADIYVAYKK
jgi:protein-S-isoprenylcysteine O-methyltransferase Ste14